MGAALAGGRVAGRTARTAARLAGPLARLALDPPTVPYRWRPMRRLERWGRDWQQRRGPLVESGVRAGGEAAARAAGAVLPLVDLTSLVRSVLGHLDLDAIATDALDDLDVGSLVDQALSQVNLTEVVVEEVDLGEVVGEALDELELTQVVLARIDLHAVVLAALDQLDLTAIVTERVDLTSIAEQVVDDIDLPGIIQESTGSVASEAVQAARMQSVEADDAVNRLADKLLLRVRGRRAVTDARLDAETTGEPDDER